MKLLYLYIFDYEGIHNQGMNFCSDWRFEYDPGQKKLSWTYNPVLPDDFYGEDSNVECISAIVDESGVGKKAVARFFSELVSGGVPPSDFVLVYIHQQKNNFAYLLEIAPKAAARCLKISAGKANGSIWLSGLGDNSNDNKSVIAFIDVPAKESKSFLTLGEHEIWKPFGFIYLSPYFSPERMILPVGSCADRATTGLMVDYAKGYDKLDLKAFKCQDMKYLLHFLKNQETQVPFEGKSSLRELLVRPNEYAFRQICTQARLGADIMDFPEQFLELCKIIDIDPGFYGRQSLFGKFFLCFFAACCYDSAFLMPQLRRQVDQLRNINNNISINYETVSDWITAFGAEKFFRKLQELDTEDMGPEKTEVRLSLSDGQSAIEELLNSYYACFPKTDFVCWSFDKSLSPGMLSVATMCARLSAWVPMKDAKEPCVVFLDDVEMILYPRDQRKLVKGFLEFFQENFKNRRFHLIFASASPVLLSDIPIGNVSIFEEETDDYGKAVKPDGMPPKLKVREVKDVFQPNTFGASIFDLYSDFFSSSEGTFGEFATKKINELLKKAHGILDRYHGKKTDIPDDELQFSAEERAWVSLIGEKVIRDYLEKVMEMEVSNV